MLDRAYVGLELVEHGVANLCLVMAREQAARLGPGWLALRDYLAAAHAQLAVYLDGADPQFDKPLAVVCPEGGHIYDESEPAAYRVGDSPMNVITPLMVYLPFIVTVAQRYQKKSGIGTIIALMLPYVALIAISWIILFAAWWFLKLPLGPGSPIEM